MKKLILAFLLAFTGFISFAQSFTGVQLQIMAKKPEEAKKELDKKLADPKLKDNAEAYYWTLAVYSDIFRDSVTAAKYPGSDSIALAALNQYAQKDTSLKLLRDNAGIIPSLDFLRVVSFNNGITYFRKSNWLKSYNSFKVTDNLDGFMVTHHMLNQNYIDTNVVLLTGYAAQNSGLIPEAIEHYKRLADRQLKVGDSNDFGSNMYTYLLDYYLKNNDGDDFKKYIGTAKKLFPQYNTNWDQMEMQNTTSNSSLTELLAKYKEDDAAGKMTEDQYLTYADAFAQPDKKEESKLDSSAQVQLRLTAAQAYSKAFRLNGGADNIDVNLKTGSAPTTKPNLSGIYAFNVGVLYYNVYDELGQRFFNLRGESADLKAKRDVAEKMQVQYADSSITWLQNAYNVLKAKTDRSRSENTSLNRSVDFLANLYQWKEDKARGINPKDVDKYEALYKQFDSEHDKYKN